MSLQISSLSAGYGGSDVLSDVTLSVPTGGVTALLGPNGAGKTTLLAACSGLLTPRSGTVALDAAEVQTWPPHRRAAAGLCHITEGRAVFPSLTVVENLMLMADSADSNVMERAADAFPVLGRRANQLAGTMSGGEQQMLALARAYVTAPTVVLLDEVSMGLAPLVVDEIFEFLGKLATSGVALLIVEQYVAMALSLADVVYVLDRGEIRFAGEPFELDAESLAESYLGKSP